MIHLKGIMAENTLLEFCPKCQTLLQAEKDDTKVLMKCSNCVYSKDIEGRHIIHSNKIKDDHTNQQVPFATIYDSAIKRTTRVKCRNTNCDSNNPKKWGSVTDRGFKVEPNVMIATVYDANRVATYVCRICGKIFRP